MNLLQLSFRLQLTLLLLSLIDLVVQPVLLQQFVVNAVVLQGESLLLVIVHCFFFYHPHLGSVRHIQLVSDRLFIEVLRICPHVQVLVVEVKDSVFFECVSDSL